MTDKEKLKEKYIEYQILMQQFQQLQQNLSALDKHVIELRMLVDNLDTLNKIKVDEETLIPFGGGIFLKGIIKENKNIILSVGANVCVEKSIGDTKETVMKQIIDIDAAIEQIQDEVVKTSSRLQELQNGFQKSE